VRSSPDLETSARKNGGPSTRERVLDAALASFAQRGYEATSLDALAAGLGVRKQTILYYHPSKDALLDAVVEQAATDLAQVLEDGAGRPEAVIDAVLRLGAARPELLALVREVVRLGPPVSTRLLDQLEPLVARAGARLGRDRILTAAAMVVGLATEVEVLRAAGTEPDLAWLRRRRRALLAELA
jgi:TetR/AcrR family transcriptional regulator